MRIAITGGSGSLGQALLRYLTATGADRIVVFSRDEQKRALLSRTFGWHPGVRVYAGDVREQSRLVDIFRGCEVVIHAAARKVVAAHPDEPSEMLKTNVLGSQNVIDAAAQAGVTKLLMVSSDKAVRAENVYGVSKAMMEHLAIMANGRTFAQGLRIGVVRYGNVIGSNGSVVLRWRAQAAAGESLTVSDPLMTRFWITLPQAVEFIMGALADLRGGEIVVPHLPASSIEVIARAVGGPSVRMTGMAGEATERPGGGPRQGGEKLYEELLSATEIRRVIRRNNRYIVPPFQHAEMWDTRPWLGETLPPDFSYRSDTWPWRLDVDEAAKLLTESCDADVCHR